MTEEAKKYDNGKVRLDLLAPEFLEGTARVLAFGAEKYGERNWEKGMKWGRPYAALGRHLWAWWRGEPFDDESGLPHLWHAACCLMFLIAYEQRKVGEDDRPFSGSVIVVPETQPDDPGSDDWDNWLAEEEEEDARIGRGLFWISAILFCLGVFMALGTLLTWAVGAAR